MTDRSQKSPNDDELREAITDVQDRPGDLHDARILGAARLAATERRAARAGAQRARQILPGLAVAATLLVAISLAFLWSQDVTIDPSAVRTGAPNVSPVDGAELPGGPAEFSWPAQANASGYRLVIFDTQANQVWASESIRAPRLSTPNLLSQQLVSGRTYLWVVEVNGDVTRRELGPYTFSVSAGND